MAEEAEERVTRYRTITNAVFGLALLLGAFSLVDYPIHGLEDIIMALVLFANAFLITLGIWHDVHRMLKYPFGMFFAALNYLLIFLVVIMPFTFRLIFTFGEVGEIATILYPIDVMASQIVLAAMYQSFIDHNEAILPREMILWGKESRNTVSIVAAIYAASIYLPQEVKILPLPPETPQFLQRAFLWWLAWPIAITYAAIYEKVHGIKF
ncbi:MAG: hypothetical protein ACE5Z5_01235 [Candidatus Bathyarchaeia archaeon]